MEATGNGVAKHLGDSGTCMKLSVLSIAYPLAPVGPDAAGGSEQILTQLDRTLVRLGHRSTVIACEGSRTAGELVAMPLPPGPLDQAVHAAAQERYRDAIRAVLQRSTFDVIHMHSLDFHRYLPPEGPPILVTLHLPPDWYPPEIFEPVRPQTWLHCVSASQECACPRSPALLPHIANGVPVEQLQTHVGRRDYALALGRICPEKGFALAIDAATEAGVPIITAGEVFPYRAHQEYFRNELQPRLDGHARRFVGPVGLARKRRLMGGARCLLVPSLVNETSSLVSMEALACGTPVIAFRSGALPEIVEHGRTGFLVNDVHEMAAAIRRAGEIDPEVCRRAARQRFSADRMIGQYLNRYEMLAALAKRASSYTYRDSAAQSRWA
jgi:glycosyltransferase involved in cell wall biosynthesis